MTDLELDRLAGLHRVQRMRNAEPLQTEGRKLLFSRCDFASVQKRGPDLVAPDLQGAAA